MTIDREHHKPEPVLAALAEELDQTYRAVAARLPDNPAVRFEMVGGKQELILSPLDKLEDPPSLLVLRAAVTARLPRVELPELLLEIAARTDFTQAFTHVSEATARAADLGTSLVPCSWPRPATPAMSRSSERTFPLSDATACRGPTRTTSATRP